MAVLLSISSVWPLASLVLIVYTLYRFVVHPLFLSPLARIPSAHWSSALSPLWILYIRWMGRQNATLEKAHRRLGPVVRLGPNDVSVDSIDHVRTVYTGGFDKTGWYAIFENYGVPCMFSTESGKAHSLRKRMVTHVYSKSYIHGSLAVHDQTRAILLDRLLPILAATTAPQSIDVLPLFLALSMDCITAYIFGLRGSADFLRRPAVRDRFFDLYQSAYGSPFFPQELPGLTRFLRQSCGISPYPRCADAAHAEMAAWNQARCEAAQAYLDDEKGPAYPAPGDEPVVMRALLANLHREEAVHGTASPLYDTTVCQRVPTLQSELFDHVLAGHETTGITLTYLAWHLSRHPAVQTALQTELRQQLFAVDAATPDTPDALPAVQTVDALPLLHAVIMETLRLRAAIPGPQPRQTPPQGCRLGDYELPGRVRIAAQAHTLHRDPRIFPDPETWDPARWLDSDDGSSAQDEEAKRARARQFWAFSSGGRMCIGSHFAMHEMKMTLATIYSRYTTRIVDDTGIEPTDGYTSRPSSGQLHLQFVPLP